MTGLVEAAHSAPPDLASGETHRRGLLAVLADYWTLTKPEVNFLVVASTLAGFDAGSRGPLDWVRLAHTLMGTLLVASGTGTLNQFIERRHDARMRRTSNRPLPAGRLASSHALGFGILLSLAGGLELLLAVNVLASALALATLASYLVLYTPLKRRTPLCTLVGAFPGAMPPLIGWAAARGSLSLEAWVLYAILFLWQFPHFLAIAWMYREDYTRAGLQMLPSRDVEQGRLTRREIFAFTLALVPVSLIPVFLGHAGSIYFVGTLAAGLGFLACAARLLFSRSNVLARRVVLASVAYLPLVLALLIVDKIPG
ncbi:MAG TPA: heme o synthase [Terriglobia bacterium]|nr:heme o synthase [Terriglobia bacterium]